MDQRFLEHKNNQCSSWSWPLGNISSLGTEFLLNVLFKPGNGAHIKFCKDNWLSGIPLIVDFPNLFNIAVGKNSSLAEYRANNYWDVHLGKAVQDEEMESLMELLAKMESFNSN